MGVIRPAGNNERRCIVRDVLGLYGSIISVGTYRSQDPNQNLSKDIVFKALKRCIEGLPTLSTIVKDSDTEAPQLAQAVQIDLDKHVHFLNGSDIQSLLEQAHNEPLTDYETQPQWQLYITPSDASSSSFHVAFATSHALVDGTSGLIFHRTFLAALRNTSQPIFTADPVFLPTRPRSVPPALEAAGNLSISWSFLAGPLLEEFFPAWLNRLLGFSKDKPGSSKPWCGAETKPAVETFVRTAVHVTSVPPEILSSALAACRKHKARLTGLLNYLTCRALARALHARGQEYSRFITETALDLRRCLPVEYHESMGNFPSAIAETVEISPPSLEAGRELVSSDWETIQTTTKLLSERSSTLADQATGLLKFLSNYREWTIKQATSPMEASFGMSNLGTFDGSNKDDSTAVWEVTDMTFSQSADATGPPFNLNVASGKHGSLMLIVSWMPGVLGVEDERLFVQDMMRDVVAQLQAVSA
ncbi:hypothetical protein PRZ48_003780 [Zasmidium cellare]|uniref:Alcohol acetyltransferase n=1 Tax=Zasmidium cellare TaxID=395010 RepID=A0ABR0EXM7_ZASCE|nr:hypothetical protein PRZ48_003780 [Zasmidium cellare]